MDDLTMRLRYHGYSTATISAPHCNAFRSKFDPQPYIRHPAIDALEAIGPTPGTQVILERIESVKNFEFVDAEYMTPSSDKMALDFKRSLVSSICEIQNGESFKVSINRCHILEKVLRKTLRPEDFTFEQRLTIFNAFSEKILKQMEDEYYYKNTGNHPPYAHKDDPTLCIISKRLTLGEWNKFGRKEFEGNLAKIIDELKAIYDITGYDWSPLSYVLGDDIEKFSQLKGASLMAEFVIAQNFLKQEYENFLKIINDASQLGTMRENQINLNCKLTKRFKIRVSIKDTGGGAKMMHSINNTSRSVSNRVRPTTDFVKDVGGFAFDLGKLLFGRNK